MVISSLSNSDFNEFDSSNEDFRDIDKDVKMILQSIVIATNSYHSMFNKNKLWPTISKSMSENF